MRVKKGTTLSVFLTIAVIVRAASGQVTAEQVDRAIRRGSGQLLKTQNVDGRWSEEAGYPGGLTALCTLALLVSGSSPDSRPIQAALSYLRSLDEPQMVYSTALQTMVFCLAEPEADAQLISRNVQWLEKAQLRGGPYAGAWSYSDRAPGGGGDHSNSQFALLALHEAERVGIKVEAETWRRAREHWLQTQNEDGSWSYSLKDPGPRGSMTCAGIAAVIITEGKSAMGDALVEGETVQCCGQQLGESPIERGLTWLAKEFSVARNPRHGATWLYYYLYGLERVGRLTGRRFMGQHDWFREGADFLVNQQDPLTGFWQGSAREGRLVATSFALLFLSKGKRPVLLSQLRYGGDRDWNHHRSAVRNLTRRVETSWRQDLTWQTIDLAAATTEDLLGSPVLFLSGRDSLPLTRDEKNRLREYVNLGGFLFVENCCDGVGFDTDFRALVEELFPESSLRLLPPEHAVWYADGRVDERFLRPLYGVDACCRTSVIYCPEDLGCYWELSRGERESDYPPEILAEIEACLQIGQNVMAYATNRELRSKLDRPPTTAKTQAESFRRGVLSIPKLLYAGGGDDAPNALPNLLNFLATQGQLRVAVENRLLNAENQTLFEYPIIFLHGRRAFRFTEAERDVLREYLKRGGFLFADAICGSRPFADSFRREMANLTDATPQRIPPEHELFTDQYHGYQLDQVTIRDPATRREGEPVGANLRIVSPVLEGVEVDGQLAAVLSPYDLSCALEYSVSLECRGYVKEDAAKLGLNVVLYALQR